MNALAPRRSGLVLSCLALLSLVVALLVATPHDAHAATIYACKTRDGTMRLVGKKTKCKKGQKKIKWNTVGPAGRNGSNGSNGSNGQPQRMVKFSASQPNAGRPVPISLFTADGITYTFSCQFVIFFDVGVIAASGSGGQSYGSGIFRRPNGITALATDLRTDATFAAIGASPATIASTATAATSDGSIRQFGVWSVTVEGPTSTTWIRAWFDTDATCSVRGTALTVPN